MKKKICCVVQRYGVEINGGAEDYTRKYCEKLKEYYDITVATTTAIEYQKWSNYYNEGVSVVNGVTVRYFKTDKERESLEFGKASQNTIGNPFHTSGEAYDWIYAQGPVSSGIISYIKENKDRYDVFIFFTYLYYPTVIGLPLVKEKSILVPFCHDEPPVYLKCFDDLFNSASGIIYNTEAEKEFIFERFGTLSVPSILTGIGLDIPEIPLDDGLIKQFNLEKPYILYMGRIDVSKGCDKLFSYFIEYKERYNNDLQLVLIGNEILEIPQNSNIISLGFVSEIEKYLLLRGCMSLVLPSFFESLSIVVLEAFEFKKPVLVCGHCEVLKRHCINSNGGLYYYHLEDFCDCLELLYSNCGLRENLGLNGKEYVDKNYQWGAIMKKVTTMIDDFVK